MTRVQALSNSRPEIDGLDDLLMDREQAAFDLAFHRENRREQLDTDARAELRRSRMSRQLRLGTTPAAR